jgi:hypothetical protein
MKENYNKDNSIGEEVGYAAGAIGRGLLAGIAGTAAITLSQMVEMKITKRESSNTPAEAVEKVLPVETESEEQKEQLSNLTHYAYGTSWGIPRALIDMAGVHGWKATALHLGAVWGTALVMLPKLEVAPPVKKWSAKQIAIDIMHHTVYAIAAGLVYDSIKRPAHA